MFLDPGGVLVSATNFEAIDYKSDALSTELLRQTSEMAQYDKTKLN